MSYKEVALGSQAAKSGSQRVGHSIPPLLGDQPRHGSFCLSWSTGEVASCPFCFPTILHTLQLPMPELYRTHFSSLVVLDWGAL